MERGQSFPIRKPDIREFSINSLYFRISYFAPEIFKHSGLGVPPACIRGVRGAVSSGVQRGGVCACGPPPEWGKIIFIFGPDAEGLATGPTLRDDMGGA